MASYEIHGIRDDGSVFGGVGFESETRPEYEADAEAYAVAEHYAKLWTQAAEVRLYKTPEANWSSVSSFDLWPGKVEFITKITCHLRPEESSACDELNGDVRF